MSGPTRTRAAIAVLVVGAAAGGLAAAAVIMAPAGHPGTAAADPSAAVPASTAAVQQRDLSSQVNVNGTLGYAGSYPVTNQARGTVTSVPGTGDIIGQGHVLYQVDGKPVVLLRRVPPPVRTYGSSTPTSSRSATRLPAISTRPRTSSPSRPRSRSASCKPPWA